MKVKIFTATNMQDALAQVKNDLGRDAIILHSRRFRKGGFLGFFSKEMVEVMAALETPVAAVVEKKSSSPAPIIVSSQRTMEEEAKNTAIQLELANMRKLLEQVVAKIPRSEQQASSVLQLLLKNDVDMQIAENLVRGLPEENAMIGSDQAIVRNLLYDRICNYLQKVDGIVIPETGCKTVALIGPTGVGKTTTIAKLAANFAIKEGFRVALITADTYRIAAVEQLKTYSDIIGVPVDVVYSPDELKAALYRHRDKQLVLIDTAGRSQKNQYHLAELQALLAVDPYIEAHLVLSTTTKYSDLLDIVNKFSVCTPQKFLLTKIDEAGSLGTVFNLLYQFPAAISYVTTGQSVPDDIELANPYKLANLILRD